MSGPGASDAGGHSARERVHNLLLRTDASGRRSFALINLIALLAVPLAAILVALRTWVSGASWHEIGLGRPRSIAGVLTIGLVLGITLKVFMKAIVLPLLGAPAVAEGNSFMLGKPLAAAAMALYVPIGAALCEEIVFRGYSFHFLTRLFRTPALGCSAALLITSLVFATAHWPRGLVAVEQAFIGGLILGSIYWVSNRSLWTVIVAHAVFDLMSVWMAFKGLEYEFAHLIFK